MGSRRQGLILLLTLLVGVVNSAPHPFLSDVPPETNSAQFSEEGATEDYSYNDNNDELSQPPVVFAITADVPDYDLQSLKDDFENDPTVSAITTDVKSSLPSQDIISQDQTSQALDKIQQLTSTDNSTEHDQPILDALVELEFLAKRLEESALYMEVREKEDPMWPASLAAKVGSNKATQEEVLMFQQDLHFAVTGIVIMKMMEERVTFINQYVQDYLSTSGPGADLTNLFQGSDSVQVVQGLLSLKYLEGILHATNIMIEEALSASSGISNDTSDPLNALFVPLVGSDDADMIPASDNSAVNPFAPLPPNFVSDDEETLEAGFGAFVVLMLTAVGFFFVLFMIVYLALRAVRKCYDACAVEQAEGKPKSKANCKGKYEQI